MTLIYRIFIIVPTSLFNVIIFLHNAIWLFHVERRFVYFVIEMLGRKRRDVKEIIWNKNEEKANLPLRNSNCPSFNLQKTTAKKTNFPVTRIKEIFRFLLLPWNDLTDIERGGYLASNFYGIAWRRRAIFNACGERIQ